MVYISLWYAMMMGESTYTIKKNTEASVVASKEIGLEVNAEKTKYMVMSQDRNVGQQNQVHGHVWRSECRTKSQHKVR
jgi:hypothetical protein